MFDTNMKPPARIAIAIGTFRPSARLVSGSTRIACRIVIITSMTLSPNSAILAGQRICVTDGRFGMHQTVTAFLTDQIR
jgi:hypothetical protein